MNPLKKIKRNTKRKIAIKSGIPTTKSGRKKKLKRLTGLEWSNNQKKEDEKPSGDSSQNKKTGVVIPIIIGFIVMMILFNN